MATAGGILGTLASPGSGADWVPDVDRLPAAAAGESATAQEAAAPRKTPLLAACADDAGGAPSPL